MKLDRDAVFYKSWYVEALHLAIDTKIARILISYTLFQNMCSKLKMQVRNVMWNLQFVRHQVTFVSRELL